ncbi:MAG: tRNA guanosine(15) transglycosylase TgtA [Methanocalculus sp. MSAO_Arc1]|uniref:tRNA guanosine(15) transglycosylase TgtA n=1 Tax=Methanocalculus TaxID=71151 RepID=UPI000FEFE6F1|nr:MULTISPECIES: tRNA guanosine(15) transglycosylase TgtA [unclassified Methanocalculus]MCP1661955.1 7-cyano-7-deazaguanine tRNA-ribosyltransferase [Methanocalculus sp. AMF5]RQD80532.1 MAG: tRNA guanosine(15) transglycosylase TgtA [Methanocalculus sp. MSAO_Arc1]
MSIQFEIMHKDIAGRVGKLTVGGKRIRTPALLPVVNPHIQIIPPAEMAAMGIEGLITNAYIFSKSAEFRDEALHRGLHDLLGFDGLIMTDSGSFQLSVYGSVDTTNETTISFQRDIGSDIWVPLDIPTHPDSPRSTVESDLAVTMSRLREAKELFGDDAPLAGPVQGGLHLDLRERAGQETGDLGFSFCPIGAVVPLLEAYRYRELVGSVLAAKRGLPSSACVHLFGAGHPSMFALAVAMGCDIFDSAAYALYAREGRYITPAGTLKLAEMAELPCACSVCRSHTAEELKRSPEKERLLATHNLAVTQAEIARIRLSIQEGTLFELVDERCRAHPRLLDGYRELLKHTPDLERFDRATKRRFFYRGDESCSRTEVIRFHEMISRITLGDHALILCGGPKPTGFDDYLELRPPFGAVPIELSETFPAGQAEVPAWDDAMLRSAFRGIDALLAANKQTRITFSADPDHADLFRKQFPGAVVIT